MTPSQRPHAARSQRSKQIPCPVIQARLKILENLSSFCQTELLIVIKIYFYGKIILASCQGGSIHPSAPRNMIRDAARGGTPDAGRRRDLVDDGFKYRDAMRLPGEPWVDVQAEHG